jgi:putative transposase
MRRIGIEALQEAIALLGVPEIFNTDQRSQFTSDEWISVLKGASNAMSIDGRDFWIDHVSIARLWRSVTYEEVYPHGYTNGIQALAAPTQHFNFYSTRRLHQRPSSPGCRRRWSSTLSRPRRRSRPKR